MLTSKDLMKIIKKEIIMSIHSLPSLKEGSSLRDLQLDRNKVMSDKMKKASAGTDAGADGQ